MLDLTAAARAIYRGLAVETTLAWLFAIVAFPGIGALAFIFLATPGVGYTARRKRDSAAAIPGDLRESQMARDTAETLALLPETVRSIFHLARASFPFLLRGGVRIFEYRSSMLHAKTMVVDGL
ncbi:MAG: hypothetical protein HY815_18515 [Candidatus Riflebacteria bacterium]|nr:hypothetical protein [Candidatus Riflebacteria bacterium]